MRRPSEPITRFRFFIDAIVFLLPFPTLPIEKVSKKWLIPPSIVCQSDGTHHYVFPRCRCWWFDYCDVLTYILNGRRNQRWLDSYLDTYLAPL